MKRVDLTVAVTAHDEDVVAGPTMRSAELACQTAEAAGLTIQRLVGLDVASADSQAFFRQSAFASWCSIEIRQGDLGLSRNALCEEASGRWIAFLDADDLFSENWLVVGAELLARAEKTGDRIIVHPELNWLFDRAAAAYVKIPQDDPAFTPYFLYFANYYDSLCLAPLVAHKEVPYQKIDLQRGFGYEDWHFNIETMAAGWRHVTAPDTIIFKRRRDDSLVVRTGEARAILKPLESMAIDRIRDLPKSAPTTGSPPRPARTSRRPATQVAIWLVKGRAHLVRDYLRIRWSGEFDEAFYLATYDDVRKCDVHPLAHYVAHGAHEGRQPKEPSPVLPQRLGQGDGPRISG